MPKFLLILLSLLPLASRASAPNETEDLLARPKVAVVLAGGGAKGLAHIGALKVLEETGIPIDIVVGNSMGSIVGGLYALGYTPQEMDSVVRATDWINLLLDAPDYGNQMLTARKQSERYQLRTALNPERHLSRTGRSGLIHGDNIEKLLRHLTKGTSDTCDFNDFPLPFACNATEVETGAIHEFHSGDLVKAMRASMAIPGVFTPVLLDSVMFVDGFVTNNYPVDVARRMGADIIIGLDLVNNVPAEERYNNLLDLVTHMIDISGTHLYQDNIANTNVYVDIDATGYGAASFGKADIDSLIVRGERRARQLLPQICELRDSLFGIYGNYEPRYKQAQRQRQELLTKIHPHTHEEGGYLRRVRNNYLNSSINLGVRYDNDEYVSMHMSMHLNLPGMSRHAVHMFGRLGQRLKGGVSVRHNFKHQGRMELKYFFEHRDLQYYFHGNRMADATSHHQRTELAYGQNWHNVIVSAGLRYDWHLYQDILTRQLTSINTDLDRVRYFSYFAQAEYNTQNSIYYPMYGSHVEGSLEVITDNLYQYKKQQAIPIMQMQWNSAFTLGNSQFTLIPHASTRIILSDGTELPLTLSNVVGGLVPGMKVSHQITMSGMRDLEMVLQDAVITGGLGLQQRMGTSHYIQASVDAGSFSSGILDAFNHVSHTWGAQMGYCYSSMAGPISLTAYWNERTKAVRLMLNVGYCF